MDAAEAEGEGEADDTLYCFCQQKSYGEMIGCDNGECEYEWVSRNRILVWSCKADKSGASTRRHRRCRCAGPAIEQG